MSLARARFSQTGPGALYILCGTVYMTLAPYVTSLGGVRRAENHVKGGGWYYTEMPWFRCCLELEEIIVSKWVNTVTSAPNFLNNFGIAGFRKNVILFPGIQKNCRTHEINENMIARTNTLTGMLCTKHIETSPRDGVRFWNFHLPEFIKDRSCSREKKGKRPKWTLKISQSSFKISILLLFCFLCAPKSSHLSLPTGGAPPQMENALITI